MSNRKSHLLKRFLSCFRGHSNLLDAQDVQVNSAALDEECDSPTTTESFASRYDPCRTLSKRGIRSIVWFEDVLVLYGSDTAVFDLFLLVDDNRKAADVLVQEGYREIDLGVLFPNDDRSCRGGIRLKGAKDQSSDAVVLIEASRWKYDLTVQTDFKLAPFPPLNKFLESLMIYWVTMPESEYEEKLLWALSLVNLINYAYYMDGPNRALVRDTAFAQQLPIELSELHYDLVGDYPQKTGISTYRKHEYHALRFKEIQAGTFTPRPYPKDFIPPSLAQHPDLTGLRIAELTGKLSGASKFVLEKIDESSGSVS